MTSLRQIESNRRNALKSTGPKTDFGKQRVGANAVRHGLTAETVILPLEDPEEYKAFELAVTSSYDAETAVERELVLRLTSLLWRLRRTTLIETELFHLQCDPPQATQQDCARLTYSLSEMPSGNIGSETSAEALGSTGIAAYFLRVTELDNGVFERLGRYEAALWRQVRQTLFTLELLRWRKSSARYSPRPVRGSVGVDRWNRDGLR